MCQAPLRLPCEPRDARSSTCRRPLDAPIRAWKRLFLGRRLKQIQAARLGQPARTMIEAGSLQGFLARNGQPHRVLDPDSDSCAKTLIERFDVNAHHLPIVLCPNGKLLRNPSENELARCIGLLRPIDAKKVYDVAIVGAGPAGLAAAVYAASEGLEVIVLDCRAFGGQAGASSRIENYLGFPTGISGMALMARAYNRAQKFGVEMVIPDQAHQLSERTIENSKSYFLTVGDDERLRG